MSKDVWRNNIEMAAWVERNCRVCYQPDEARARRDDQHACPHLLRSLANKLPTPWKRRRNAPMGETYTCSAFMEKPKSVRRQKVRFQCGCDCERCRTDNDCCCTPPCMSLPLFDEPERINTKDEVDHQ